MKKVSKMNQVKAVCAAIVAGMFVSGCETEIKTARQPANTTTTSTTTSGASLTDLLYSNACRADNATFDPMNPGTRNRSTLTDEGAGNLVAKGNALVPDPNYDTDGFYNDDWMQSSYGLNLLGIPAKRVFLETVKGRPSKLCGQSGDTDARIADCESKNTISGVNHALWEGSKYGTVGESDWKLVALNSVSWCENDANNATQNDCINNGNAWTGTHCASMETNATWCTNDGGTWTAPQAVSASDSCGGGTYGGCLEVWRDERTKLVWSAPHRNADVNGNYGYNWFQAAGYSKNGSTLQNTFFEGGAAGTVGGLAYDPNCQVDWNNPLAALSTCQPQHPVSVCADAGELAGLRGVAAYQNPDGTDIDGIGIPDERPAKGNMTGATHQWRLPTIEDFKVADANGIRKVMSLTDTCFWSASSSSGYRSYAWDWCGNVGVVDYDSRSNSSPVVCVGR